MPCDCPRLMPLAARMFGGMFRAFSRRAEAVGTDLGKKFVLVIDKDNKAIYRSVDLGPKLEGLRIVRSGLDKADRIVINGLQRVRPGAVVAPQDAPMASPETVATLTRQRQAIEAGNQPSIHEPNQPYSGKFLAIQNALDIKRLLTKQVKINNYYLQAMPIQNPRFYAAM